MRVIIISITLISVIAQPTPPAQSVRGKLTERWHVTFSLQGGPKKQLIFEAPAKGAGTFKLLDTGVDDNPVPDPAQTVWSEFKQ